MSRKTSTSENRIIRLCTSVSLVFLVLALVSCSTPDSPEEQIREYVSRAAAALEDKDTGEIKDLIAAGYSDKHKNTRQEVVRILAGYFLRRQNIHLLTNVRDLTVAGDNSSAAISVYAAVSRVPVEKDDLNLLDASFYHLEGTLIHQDGWLLETAELQRISSDEFISSFN